MSLNNNYASYLEILNQLTYDRKKFVFSTIKKKSSKKGVFIFKEFNLKSFQMPKFAANNEIKLLPKKIFPRNYGKKFMLANQRRYPDVGIKLTSSGFKSVLGFRFPCQEERMCSKTKPGLFSR